tara:strand:+ start:4835 stop:5230 length:396 start_codon:yes stop_codon:yes gene_type:complete
MSQVPTSPSKMELEHRLEWLIPQLQNKIDEHYAHQHQGSIILGKTFLSESAPPVLTVNKGRTYWKLVKENRSDFGGNSRTVYGFVRISDGAIFKAATWRQPETRTKGAIRGSIMDEYCEQYFTQWGVIYDL